ncbi:hypothetical protein [Spirosoma spitsbergense]|uniref:hypothetical protein n=1 Tax=Spirosoma spitsbergense TaxID=431554 RepID=UPI00035FD852|nr:hypothetical protein [Spirosoma spitsbergense]
MSRHANAGLLIRTGSGKLAIWYHRDKPFTHTDGKTRVQVTLLDDDYRPLADTKPVLCNPDLCTQIGFSD